MTKRHLAAYCALAAAAMSFGYWFRGESDASDPQQSYPENTENRGSPILAPPRHKFRPAKATRTLALSLGNYLKIVTWSRSLRRCLPQALRRRLPQA